MSYDKKYIRRTIEYMKEGHTYRETATIFKVSTNSLCKWVKEGIEGKKGVKRKEYKGRKIERSELEEYIEGKPDAYQAEMAR